MIRERRMHGFTCIINHGLEFGLLWCFQTYQQVTKERGLLKKNKTYQPSNTTKLFQQLPPLQMPSFAKNKWKKRRMKHIKAFCSPKKKVIRCNTLQTKKLRCDMSQHVATYVTFGNFIWGRHEPVIEAYFILSPSPFSLLVKDVFFLFC